MVGGEYLVHVTAHREKFCLPMVREARCTGHEGRVGVSGIGC